MKLSPSPTAYTGSPTRFNQCDARPCTSKQPLKVMSGVNSGQQFEKTLRLGHACGFTSFQRNRSTGALEYDVSIVRKSFQAFLFLGLVLYQWFLSIQCWKTLISKDADIRQQMRMLYATLSVILLSVNHYVQIHHGREYLRLMNGFRYFMLSKRVHGT